MSDTLIFVILMVVVHAPVVAYAVYGAIKLAKYKKDPNYRMEIKKKGPQPLKMLPPMIGFLAMSVIGLLNLLNVLNFGTPTLLYMGAPLFVLTLVGFIFILIKKKHQKGGQ